MDPYRIGLLLNASLQQLKKSVEIFPMEIWVIPIRIYRERKCAENYNK